MKVLLTRAIAWVAVVAASIAPAALTQAAEGKGPVAVVSVANVDQLTSNVGYILQTAGQADMAKEVIGEISTTTQGLDKTKPAGVLVTLQGTQPQVLAFVPVTDLKALRESLKEKLGEGKEAAGGVWEFDGGPEPLFLKQDGAYAFISRSSAELGALPKDPVSLLGGLEKQYDVAVRANIQNIPESLVKLGLDQLKVGVELGLQKEPGETDEQFEAKKKLALQSVANLEKAAKELESITLGWKVDNAAKNTYLDLSFTAVEGSDAAKEAAKMGELKTAFGGFLMPGAAVTYSACAKSDGSNAADVTSAMKAAKERILKELEKDGDLEGEKLKAAQDIVSALVDALEKTIASGKLDLGASLLLKEKSFTFVAGGYVAEPKLVEDAFKKLIDEAKKDDDFQKKVTVKMDADKHGDVKFHTLGVTLDEEKAQKVFGKTLDVCVGFGEKTVYFGLGNDCAATLKKVMDASAAAASTSVPTTQINVSLAPIFKFAASVDDDETLKALSTAAEKSAGKDKVRVYAKPITRGSSIRIEVDEGVLKIIGEAVDQSN